MTPIIQTDVTGFATGLAAVSAGAWTDILAYVNQYNLTTCDTDIDRRLARIYLAAHLATMGLSANAAGVTGASGPLISEAAGDVRNAYGFVSMSSGVGALSLTRWGLMFLEIIEESLCGLPMLL